MKGEQVRKHMKALRKQIVHNVKGILFEIPMYGIFHSCYSSDTMSVN